MDEKNFYDSLDELNALSGASFHSQQLSPVTGERRYYDIANVVPLYGRETLKDYIKMPEKSKHKVHSKIPIPNISTGYVRTQKAFGKAISEVRMVPSKYKKKSSSIKDIGILKEEKSYTTLFYRRIGHPNGKMEKAIANDTVRAQCGDCSQRTDESSLSTTTHYSDAQSYISNSTSFYFKLIDENDFKRLETNTSASNVSSIADMHSISECFANCSDTMKKEKKIKKKVSLAVPDLGGLGPDTSSNQDKLKRLRKQIHYGQKASTYNRIKMLEVKALKEVKEDFKKLNSG